MNDNKMSKQVTMIDIATEAGVSVSTVSLALSGKGNLSDSLRETIKNIAQELGYNPKQRKVKDNPRLIALIMEEIPFSSQSDQLFSQLILGIQEVLTPLEYHCALCVISNKKEEEHYTFSLPQGLAGAIIMGGGDLTDDIIYELVKSHSDQNIPFVLVDNAITSSGLHAIVPDNFNGGIKAAQHLIERGHHTIGIIEGPSKYRTLTERAEGFICGLMRGDITLQPQYRSGSTSHGPLKGYEEMKYLLSVTPRPTAVFAVSDRSALGALKAIQEHNLRIPDDIALVGFDDSIEAQSCQPALTTVSVPWREMGHLTASRLISLVAGNEPFAYISTLPTNLIIRTSS